MKNEGSIIEAWVAYESLTFYGMYLTNVQTVFNRPQRNNDGGVRKGKFSVFVQVARPFGEPIRGEPFTKKDMDVAHWFILNYCDETMIYLDEHEQMMKWDLSLKYIYAKKHRELFPRLISPIYLKLFFVIVSGKSVKSIQFTRLH